MLVLPKTAAHLVKKTENMRIFTPEQNIDADAYKFDYRIYYDVFVNKSGLDAVWGWVSPTVNITAQPESITVDEGNISESLTVSAESDGELTYQWYKCTDENKSGAVKVAGANTATLNIPTDLTEGMHYFFVKIIVDGAAASESEAAVVTVA